MKKERERKEKKEIRVCLSGPLPLAHKNIFFSSAVFQWHLLKVWLVCFIWTSIGTQYDVPSRRLRKRILGRYTISLLAQGQSWYKLNLQGAYCYTYLLLTSVNNRLLFSHTVLKGFMHLPSKFCWSHPCRSSINAMQNYLAYFIIIHRKRSQSESSNKSPHRSKLRENDHAKNNSKKMVVEY